MPWELTLQRSDLQTMDDVETIRRRIEAVVPDVRFYTEPSGLQKLEAAAKMGVEFPDVLRRHFENLPAKLYAVYSTEELTITIYGFESQPLTRLHLEIRGDQNPGPVLQSLCECIMCCAVDDQTGETVDFNDRVPNQ